MKDGHQSVEWLEAMLAHAVNLMSQVNDQVDLDKVIATTGPADNPDQYDTVSLISEVRKSYPTF